MPPEEPGNLTVIDLRFGDDKCGLRAAFERVDVPIKEWLAVSWASRTPPAGYSALGAGVVYYKDREGLAVTTGEGEVDRIGSQEASYGWRQNTSAQGLMLVLILPAGYTLARSSARAEAAKAFDGDSRIAVYWMLTSRDGRVALKWSLARSSTDAPSEAARLNESLYAGAGGASPGYAFLAEPGETSRSRPDARRVQVFCSYSHEDEDYLQHLLKYLDGMKEEGFAFWYDRKIRPGSDWDASIKEQIAQADIALMLISQSFLNSEYVKNVEIRDSLERREREGLRLFPVLLSPCDWKSQPWLARMQMIPRDDETLETHYKESGERKAIFLTILKELRALGRTCAGRPV